VVAVFFREFLLGFGLASLLSGSRLGAASLYDLDNNINVY
jgi:hypothetical protein